ncbi:MAG: amino acid adenylation domain-containing protein [Blastocatellia bacterium]
MLIRLTEQTENPARAQQSPDLTARLGAAELHQVLVDFNNSAAAFQREVCLHQLVEAQAQRSPQALGIVFADEIATYHEINGRANRLAHELRRRGVGPETLVGVCLDRSPELVIALCAILKAGGAYVPLDPSYPSERLAVMLADSQARIVITQSNLKAHLKSQISDLKSEIELLCTDRDLPAIAPHNAENPDSGVTEDNLAYVIYTSGSTGQPKGVMIEHRGICNQLQWMQQQYPLTADDAVLLKTPFSFDLSLYELFSPLMAGARQVIAAPGRQNDPAYLTELIRRERVTTLFMVPSHLQLLLEHPGFAACDSLRRVFCSGEPLPLALQKRFFDRMPRHTTLHNLYGPTEASVEATFWDCERRTRRQFVPVGRPIANYQIYILDEHLSPVPVGESGELCIGGIGLARGYLNQPELTAEKFILWKSEVGSRKSEAERQMADGTETAASLPADYRLPTTDYRLYRTGDLARWLPEGIIECLGRIDFQVKIRGHRIEPGEIETTLTTHPTVRECVVVAREDEPGHKRLVAYFAAAPEATPVISELRELLRQRLPDYMIPAAFVRLDAFPLSPNGKLDRRRLPAPETGQAAADFIAPADETEARLAAIWEKELRIHPVGVRDNFFDLGGHSLIAVRIFAAIEKQCGIRLPLATLFQAPTIREQAELLRAQGGQVSWSSLVPLQPQGSRPPFFCVHAIGGNVLEYYELARCLGADQPFYGLQSVGLDGRQQPLETIEAMAAHYLTEVRELQPAGPYYLGGRSFGGMVAFEMAQQLQRQGEQTALLAMLDTDPIGWLRLLSRRAAWRQQAVFLSLRIRQHLANLGGRTLADKFDYLREKAAYKKRRLDTWRWQMKRLAGTSASASMTETLWDVEELNYLAARRYVPQVYPGVVTFFAASEEVSIIENECGWRTLAGGGLEVIQIPGNHQSMIREPHVRLLAERLKHRLGNAQMIRRSS